MTEGANPWVAGLLSRCPNCGKGPLYVRFWSLRVRDACEVCAADLTRADTGDGPAVFVTLIGGTICVFGMLFAEVAYHPPIWVHLVVSLPLTVLVCMGLLKPFKGLLVAAQFVNKASQSRHGD